MLLNVSSYKARYKGSCELRNYNVVAAQVFSSYSPVSLSIINLLYILHMEYIKSFKELQCFIICINNFGVNMYDKFLNISYMTDWDLYEQQIKLIH